MFKLVSDGTWESLETEVKASFAGVKTIALDCEGVDLSRLGRISLVQTASPSSRTVYVFDVLGLSATSTSPMLEWLGSLITDGSICKVIHDCRMDSDALSHLLGIQLTNVHDTSCWHAAITGQASVNLNDCLAASQLTQNALRGGVNYESTPNYWASRPVSEAMLACAAGDLTSLLELQTKQIAQTSPSIVAASASTATAAKAAAESVALTATAARATAASAAYTNAARSARVEVIKVTGNVGRFIGPRGSNIRSLQTLTNTTIYQTGPRADRNFMVFYHTDASLLRVKDEAKKG